MRLGREGGSLAQREYRIVSNLLALWDVRVADVLTPRTVVFSLPNDLTVEEAAERFRPIRFARIPVYERDPERIIGYVPRFDIGRARDAGRGTQRLAELVRPILVIPALAPVAAAFEQMLTGRHHIAVAVDEHGGMEGIVTLEDLLETLLGEEIVDETDTTVDMRELARRRRRLRSEAIPPLPRAGERGDSDHAS